MSELLLSIRNLRVQFGRFVAVDDVSFELRGGELLGMIGPNGAGKTTTLRAAAGLQPVSTGEIRVLGHDVFRRPTVVGQHIGFAPDTPQVYDTLSVEQFLQFIARCYGLDVRLGSERIGYWLDQLWLSEKRTARVGALSRGMRQRLAVARTLLADPHVVLLDEPAAGLDPAGRVQFRQLLANLRDQGKAIIVSSHILADLAEYCTHIAMMGHGKLIRYGSVATVTGAADDARCQYRVVLAERIGDAATRLGRIADVQVVRAEADVLTLEHRSDRAAAASLLARLLAEGLPVAEFRPLQADLEQAYLRTGIRQVD